MTTVILLGMAGLLAVLLLFVAVTKAGASNDGGADTGPLDRNTRTDDDGGDAGGDGD